MRAWIPVPGSARARLLEAGTLHFERDGYEAASVTAIAAAAGVTTGSLYHHFGSKLELFRVIRLEMERRVRDRMEGAAAGAGGGRRGVRAALLVGFDAAVYFRVPRILSERRADLTDDVLSATVATLLPAVRANAHDGVLGPRLRSGRPETPAASTEAEETTAAAPTAAVLLGAWRAALEAVASGAPPSAARAGLAWCLGEPTGAATP